MRETEQVTEARDATVEEACPACGGQIVARAGHGAAWVYCRPCRRISRSMLVPAPTGGSMLVHPLAAA